MGNDTQENEWPAYQLPDGIRSTSNQDGGTILDIDRSRIFRVNAVGASILDCLRQGWSEAKIAAHVACQYAINQETARTDVHEFLESLKKHNLITQRKNTRTHEHRGQRADSGD